MDISPPTPLAASTHQLNITDIRVLHYITPHLCSGVLGWTRNFSAGLGALSKESRLVEGPPQCSAPDD